MLYQDTSLNRCNETHTSVFHNKKILEAKMIEIDYSRLRSMLMKKTPVGRHLLIHISRKHLFGCLQEVITITNEIGIRWRKLNSFRRPNNHIITN